MVVFKRMRVMKIALSNSLPFLFLRFTFKNVRMIECFDDIVEETNSLYILKYSFGIIARLNMYRVSTIMKYLQNNKL